MENDKMQDIDSMSRAIKYRSEHNEFGRLLGIEILDYSEGYAKASMRVRLEYKNPLGTVHGGCLYALADSVGGTASATYGFITPTVSGDLHFLRPAVDMEKIYAEAKVIKHGKTIGVYDVTIYGEDEKTVLACGTFTYFNKNIRIG